ncbi:MAG: hypothetical protein ACRELB_05420, partial [Polyangiaceae bacterium]
VAMRAGFLVPAVPALVAVTTLVAACSSSGGAAPDAGLAGEGGQDAPGQDASAGDGAEGSCAFSPAACSVADVFVNAEMTPTATSSLCPFSSTQPWLAIGIPGASRPTTIVDGGQENFATVHVACSVVPVGTGFDVALSVLEDNASAAGLVITSPAGTGAVTGSGAAGIAVDWKSNTLTATQSDCTLRFTYGAGPVPSPTPVSAGRIWAHVSCPQATFVSDAGAPVTCDGEADFLFENCAQ